MGRQRDLMCGLSEQESSLKTPKRSGIDPTVAIFASAALSVKRRSEGSENSIEVPSCYGPACGCSPSCDCKPECHCEGFVIDPNTVTLVASTVARTTGTDDALGGSKKSIEAEGGHPSKTRNDCGQMATMPMWIDHGSCSQPHDMKK